MKIIASKSFGKSKNHSVRSHSTCIHDPNTAFPPRWFPLIADISSGKASHSLGWPHCKRIEATWGQSVSQIHEQNRAISKITRMVSGTSTDADTIRGISSFSVTNTGWTLDRLKVRFLNKKRRRNNITENY